MKKPVKVKPQEVWEVGIVAYREKTGSSTGASWKDIVRAHSPQVVGWKAIADWINKNFVRKSLIILAILPISVMPAAEAALRL